MAEFPWEGLSKRAGLLSKTNRGEEEFSRELLHSKKNKELLAKAHEEFSKKEKEFSELQPRLQQLYEKLAKRENEFKHQLEEKEQKIQEYSYLLQECLDALYAQKQKNESLNIQLLHSPQVVLPNDEPQLKEKEVRALKIQLEKMERTLELKEKEIQERADTLYQQKVNEFFFNTHKVNHISSSTQCSIETADNATQVQEEQGNIDAGTQCDLEVESQGASIGMQLIELQDLNAELLKQLDVKQDNEQVLRKQLKAFVDELQEKKKGVILMKEQYQQQLKEIEEKDLQLSQSKEKGEALQFELNKKQEEFTKKEKELSELQQQYHSKKEELAKTAEDEFKHQLEEKEQKIQEYSLLLQECLDALHAQKQKNESLNIQLLHTPQVVLPDDELQLKEKEISYSPLIIQLDEMERTLELKEKEIQERIYQQKVNEFFFNAHKVNHISSSTQCSIETADNATQVQEEQGTIDAGTQCDLEVKSQGASIGMQLIELQDSNAELQKQLDTKQNNEQQLHKQLKACIDELQEKKKEMKEQCQQQLKEIEEKDLQLTLSKEKEKALQFELQKKEEEFVEKEKELAELHQLKKEELAKTEHQLEKKEQKIQEYSHLLERQDALRTDLYIDKSPVKNYFVQVMYENKKNQRRKSQWLMRFLLCKDLNALIKFIEKKFQNFDLDSEISFNFEDVDGYIELCFDAITCRKGWSVIPHKIPTRVSQSTIDLYGSMSPLCFPELLITITFIPGDDTEPQLKHPVTLTGIKSDTKQLNIVLTVGDHHFATDTTNTAHMPSHDERGTAKEVFREHYFDLYDLLAKLDNISALALRLYSKKLITEDAYDNIRGKTGHDKAESVLHALKVTISIQPQSLRTLIEILRSNDALKDIANKMDGNVIPPFD